MSGHTRLADGPRPTKFFAPLFWVSWWRSFWVNVWAHKLADGPRPPKFFAPFPPVERTLALQWHWYRPWHWPRQGTGVGTDPGTGKGMAFSRQAAHTCSEWWMELSSMHIAMHLDTCCCTDNQVHGKALDEEQTHESSSYFMEGMQNGTTTMTGNGRNS